jgi:putative tryptophan/tyrosine transport system permease protein
MIVESIFIIAEQFFIHLPLVLGAYISLSCMKVPDLSIESAFVFGALCSASVVTSFNSPFALLNILLIIAASLGGGALVGMVSATLTQAAKFPHLLSSIITIGIFHGINLLVAQSSYIALSGSYNYLSILSYIQYHPELCMLLIISMLLLVCGIALCKTQLGYCLAVFGQNPDFFSHYGISSTYLFITGIIVSNALAGLSGYLVAQTSGAAEITMGIGKVLFCVTSIILGKLFVKNSTIIAMSVPVMGGITYFTLQQGLLKIGFDSKYFTMIQSLIVLVILLERYRGTSQRDIKNLGI